MTIPMIIIYDDDCGFCDWCRDLVEKYDRKKLFSFVGLSTPQAMTMARTRGRTLNQQDPESFVVCSEQDLSLWLEQSDAIRTVTKHLSGPVHMFYYLVVITPRPITNAVYRTISRHRTLLGRLLGRRTCRIR